MRRYRTLGSRSRPRCDDCLLRPSDLVTFLLSRAYSYGEILIHTARCHSMNAKSRLLTVLAGVLIVGTRLALAEGGITTKSDVREGPQPVAVSDSNVGRLIPDLEFTPVSGKKFRLSAY